MRAIIKELSETTILAMVIFLALQFALRNYQVEGSSMHPTLEQGEYVLVNKLVYFHIGFEGLAHFIPYMDSEENTNLFPFHPPRRGEVMIFRFPEDDTRDFVKRVVGIPGDLVEIRQGQLYVNEEAQDEPYVIYNSVANMPGILIQKDEYFVLGDNRIASNDSRNWGPVPTENIIGRAWVTFWPANRWHPILALPPIKPSPY